MALHVKAQQVLFDILVGMTGRDLMKKYRLTPGQLARVLESLVKAGLLKRSEVDQLCVNVDTSGQMERRSSTPDRLANAKPLDAAPWDCSEPRATTHRPAERLPPPSSADSSGPSDRDKAILDDVRAGLDDAALMEKYGLSAIGVLNVVNKFLWCGILTSEEFAKRRSLAKTVYMPVQECFSCGQVHFDKVDRCVKCGVALRKPKLRR